MLLTFDLKDYHGNILDSVATGEDDERYFLEADGKWRTDGKRAKQWRALLTSFRKSDWYGFHISGCQCNQYMAAQCSTECRTMDELLHDLYGGFPKDFNPSRDERNHYRSGVAEYG